MKPFYFNFKDNQIQPQFSRNSKFKAVQIKSDNSDFVSFEVVYYLQQACDVIISETFISQWKCWDGKRDNINEFGFGWLSFRSFTGELYGPAYGFRFISFTLMISQIAICFCEIQSASTFESSRMSCSNSVSIIKFSKSISLSLTYY